MGRILNLEVSETNPAMMAALERAEKARDHGRQNSFYVPPGTKQEPPHVLGKDPSTMGVHREPKGAPMMTNRREGPGYKFIGGKRYKLRGYRPFGAL